MTTDASSMTPEEFQVAVGIGAEALDRLIAFVDLLRKWQATINLVGAGTLADPWRRHVLDSAQLFPLIPRGERVLVDVGSGAGFPGLVLAILGAVENRGLRVHLVESDARKCAFLREANRIAAAGAIIHNKRVEYIEGLLADVVTARACAPLDKLLAWAKPILGPKGLCLFPKGKSWEGELTESLKGWKMTVTRIPSVSDPSGVILKLEDIERRHG